MTSDPESIRRPSQDQDPTTAGNAGRRTRNRVASATTNQRYSRLHGHSERRNMSPGNNDAPTTGKKHVRTGPKGCLTDSGTIRDDLGHEWLPRRRFWICIRCKCQIGSTRVPCPKPQKPSAAERLNRPETPRASQRAETTVQRETRTVARTGADGRTRCAYCGRGPTGQGAICCNGDRVPPKDKMALATNPELIRMVVGAATKLPNGGLCWHQQGSYQTQGGRLRCRGCGSAVIENS